MIMKKFYFLVLLLFGIVGCTKESNQNDDDNFVEDSKPNLVYYMTSDSLALTIPSISGASVVNNEYDEERKMFKITLVNAISVWDRTFAAQTKLTQISLPSDIQTISSDAFKGCSNLVEVSLGNKITKIEDNAFSECSKLETITLPNSVTSIGKSVFWRCSNLVSINYPPKVTSIADNCFFATGLKEVILPDWITSVGEGAFSQCVTLEKAVVPSSVTSLGKGIFAGSTGTLYINCEVPGESVNVSANGAVTPFSRSHFDKVVVGDNITVLGGRAFEYSALSNIEFLGSITDLGEGVFRGCNNLKTFRVPDGVTTIKREAFKNSGIETIDFGNTVTVIDRDAFEDCDELVSVVLPDNVTTINFGAFRNCEKLQTVTFSRNTQRIEGEVLFESNSLFYVTVLATTPPTIDDFAFSNHRTPIYVPGESVQAYKEAWTIWGRYVQAIK